MTLQRARADTFADRLLQQRAPLREAPLERRGIAQARRDRSQQVPVAGGTTEGQALAPTPGWRAPGPLGRGTGGRGSRGQRSVWPLGLPAWRGGAPPPRGAGPRRRPRARSRSAPATPGTGSARLYWACQTPGPPPPRSAAAARPPGRSRRWHSMPAPGYRMLAPARRCRRARPRARGPAGPPPWRRRGLPSA